MAIALQGELGTVIAVINHVLRGLPEDMSSAQSNEIYGANKLLYDFLSEPTYLRST